MVPVYVSLDMPFKKYKCITVRMFCILISDAGVVTNTTEAPSASWCEKYICEGTWKEYNSRDDLIYNCGVGFTWDDTNQLALPPRNSDSTEEDYQNKLIELRQLYFRRRLRNRRDKQLKATDYLVNTDFPHPTPEAKQAWLDYRQALRDLPSNTTDPENPVWPEPPTL